MKSNIKLRSDFKANGTSKPHDDMSSVVFKIEKVFRKTTPYYLRLSGSDLSKLLKHRLSTKIFIFPQHVATTLCGL